MMLLMPPIDSVLGSEVTDSEDDLMKSNSFYVHTDGGCCLGYLASKVTKDSGLSCVFETEHKYFKLSAANREVKKLVKHRAHDVV
jgi:hypothetical protein